MTFARIYEEKRSFVLSLAVLVILGILYVVFGQSNWAEGPVESATRFCEKISDGLIKEPVNAFSNFTYIIVGLVILWNMPSKRSSGQPYA